MRIDFRFVNIVALACLSAACGGGGGGGGSQSAGTSGQSASSSAAPAQQSAEGFWRGTATDSASGTSFPTWGIVTPTGQALFTSSGNGIFFSLATSTLSVDASAVSSPAFITLGLGTGAGTTGTLSGGITTRFSLIAKAHYPDNKDDNYNLSYDSQYETSASLATLQGNYTIRNGQGIPTGSFAVDGNGTLSGTGEGCPISGKLSPHGDGTRNVYDLTISAASGSACTTQLANLSGLATYARLSGGDSAKSLLLMATSKNDSQYSVFVAAGLRN